MFLIGAVLWFVAEVVAFVEAGEHIGFGWAVLLLIAVSALGPLLVRRVGLGVLARTQERLARGDFPSRELLDGVVVLAGGALICIPGFISDAVGLLLLIGPVRHLVIRAGRRRIARRVQAMRTGWRVIDVRGWDEHDGPGAGTGSPTNPTPPMPPMPPMIEP